MTTEINKLNETAMQKFQKLRSSMKLDFTNLELQKNQIPLTDEEAILGAKNIHQLTNEDFSELLSSPKISTEVQEAIVDNLNYVDKAMSYIDSLNLPPNQSLAIALIISGSKKNDRSELRRAANILLNGVE